MTRLISRDSGRGCNLLGNVCVYHNVEDIHEDCGSSPEESVSVLAHVAACCSAMQHITARYSVLQSFSWCEQLSAYHCKSPTKCVAAYCSMLQHVTAWCSALQCVALSYMM